MKKAVYIGIDAGSTAASAVAMDADGKIIASAYEFHHGRVTDCLRAILDNLLPGGENAAIAGLARTVTAPGASVCGKRAAEIDDRVAEIGAVRRYHPECRTFLVVGAEKFARIAFDSDGRYRSMRGNSSCAAGTGAFLDQQSARLGLRGGSAELAEKALANSGERPQIASRCSVFAKTDLIHAQQEGWKIEEICDGLSEGLARNIADTLFPGEHPKAPVFMAGGVSRNRAVIRHLSELAGSPIATDEMSHIYGAIGACLSLLPATAGRRTGPAESDSCAAAEHSTGTAGGTFTIGDIVLDPPPARDYANPPLEGPSAGYPDFSSKRRFLYSARRTGPANPIEVDVYFDADEILAMAKSAGNHGGADSGLAHKSDSAGTDSGAIGKGVRPALPVLLGLDIGSTSTKAALVTEGAETVVGLYTRTQGRPLEAAQGIFEAVDSLENDYGVDFAVRLAATTGSGRKLVGSVIGADETIDEITAHARAAVQLDPKIDTIIEIGGQDSKFTLLKNGIVTFSQMNAVCAAGTGSFLEEQAARLGVPLSEFADRALGQKAPLTSDRCTVFMERDLNHFQSLGYSTDELLAASLYSVCDNYLGKVAQRGSIGERIFFQGATAKNRALVAVFEKRLGKKIAVSKFCHLTGAIGSALQARDELSRKVSSFRGFSLWKMDLPSRAERCGLCPNNCRLRVITVGGEEVAYGFLCGRDYGTKHFVGGGSAKFNYLPRRRQAIEAAYATAAAEPEAVSAAAAADSAGASTGKAALPTIGMPSALYLEEDAPFWTALLERLGFACVAAPDDADTLRLGKRLAGAEFCAPMALLHGQVHALLEKADYVFLPMYLEDSPEERNGSKARRYYCNYTEYATEVTRCAEHERRDRFICPLLVGRYGDRSRAVDELEKALAPLARLAGAEPPSKKVIREAYAACIAAKKKASERVRALFAAEAKSALSGSPAVLLIGRPYAVLSNAMGKGIADMIAKRDISVLYSDMLPAEVFGAHSDIDPLLAAFHWRYASEVLKCARFCATNERYYPVLITSFKCSPDACAIEWFKRILDAAGKPYLILQIDEHDSSVGYETRVEAGIRSFKNHYRARIEARPANPDLTAAASRNGVVWGQSISAADIEAGKPPAWARNGALPVNPRRGRVLKGKTVLIPSWDPLICPLIAANLRNCGLDARPLVETSASIRRGMGSNTGQCIPINIIVSDCMDYIKTEKLDPDKTVLWISSGFWPCNFPLYPYYMKSILEHQGYGSVDVYNGDIFFLYVGIKALIGTYHAFLAGSTLRKFSCRIRPYEEEKGATDRLCSASLSRLISGFEKGEDKEALYKEVFEPFAAIKIAGTRKPLVAIFGDLYARDNDVLNQNLIHDIEAAGGEAVVTSYIDYVKGALDPYLKRCLIDRSYGEWLKTKTAIEIVSRVERAVVKRCAAVLEPARPWTNPGYEEKVARFDMRPEQEGECFDNAVKIFRILDEHPDIALFAQTNPAFCCPSIISQALNSEIERITGVPVVTLNYDGTGEHKNDALVPFLSLGSAKTAGKAEKLAPAAE